MEYFYSIGKNVEMQQEIVGHASQRFVHFMSVSAIF